MATASIANAIFLRELTYSVEFGSRFADGSMLSTTNTWPVLSLHAGNTVVHHFPAMADLPLLHRLHRIYPTNHGGAAVRHAPDGGALDYLQADMRAAVEHNVAEGRMSLAGDVYVAHTVRSALFNLVRLLPPGRQIVRWRDVRPARRTLCEMGLPPHYRMTKHHFIELA